MKKNEEKTNISVNKATLPEITFRLKELVILYCNGNVKDFSEKIEISQQRINRIFNVDTRTGKYPQVIQDDVIRNIKRKFTDVSLDWLILGVGEMHINTNINLINTNTMEDETTKKYIDSLEKRIETLEKINKMLEKDLEEYKSQKSFAKKSH